jgi:Beta/Gamma crystallin
MNRIVSLSRNFLLFSLVIGLLLWQTSAFAGRNECWVDFYESPNYSGTHIRIEGPVKLRNLRAVDGQNWESRFDSLVVGPKARLQIFENTNFKRTLSEMAKYPDLMKSLGITDEEVKEESDVELRPGEMVHHLGELNFHKKTKSLKIECVK